MIETTNLKLKKYEDNDVTDPALAFNPNMDIIEKAFSNISTDAKGTKFDNATNGMASNNVQGAIEEVFQAGVNAKSNMVQAINSKITVPNVTTDNNWDILKQSVINIKEAQGNAQVSQVLSGATFTNNTGNLLTGTMVNRGGAFTVTPSTSNQVKSAGYYSGDITVKGDSNLVAGNILSGKSIFGVVGNISVSSLGGRRWASGTTSAKHDGGGSTKSGVYLEVDLNGSFTPSTIVVKASGYSVISFVYFLGKYHVSGGGSAVFDRTGSSELFQIVNNTKIKVTVFSPSYPTSYIFDWIAFE